MLWFVNKMYFSKNLQYTFHYMGVGTYVFEINCHWLSDLSLKQFMVHNGNLNNTAKNVESFSLGWVLFRRLSVQHRYYSIPRSNYYVWKCVITSAVVGWIHFGLTRYPVFTRAPLYTMSAAQYRFKFPGLLFSIVSTTMFHGNGGPHINLLLYSFLVIK